MSGAQLVLTNARLCLPHGEMVDGWLATRGDRIESIGEGRAPAAESVVDCHGKWILPGLVDIHVHFRDPGFTHKEDFESGSAAAVSGGVTTVVDMPNTGGLVISGNDVTRKLRAIDGRSYVDFGLYALLADSGPHISDLCELGVAGLKWMFGAEPMRGGSSDRATRLRLRDSLQRAGMVGMLVGVHAEDAAWLSDLRTDLEAKGRTDLAAHGEARPPFTEALAIAQAAILCQEFGCRLHVHHLSSRTGLSTLTAMRQKGEAAISAEVCPHHLFLTGADLARLGALGKVNPPLRTQDDVRALWEGVQNGSIDCVASDHAPHSDEEKRTDNVWRAESGIIGVETLFSLLFHEVRVGRLSIGRFTSLTAEEPAALVGLERRKGALLPGLDADLVVVDPEGTTTIASEALHSKHPRTPFEGLERKGSIDSVYVRGRAAVEAGSLHLVPHGKHVPSEYTRHPWRGSGSLRKSR
jgi:dihydroorotase (multifunctional complex type)